MLVSKQVGLLHYPDEFILIDHSITVAVGFIDHLLEFVIIHIFT